MMITEGHLVDTCICELPGCGFDCTAIRLLCRELTVLSNSSLLIQKAPGKSIVAPYDLKSKNTIANAPFC